VDLLLTHGYFLAEDPRELRIMKPYAPLGLLYLTSHLRACGIDVEVFDSTFSRREDLSRVLERETPAVVGIYANLMTRSSVLRILGEAKNVGSRTVVGGPEPGSYEGEYLRAGADVVVVGEGELTLEELVPVLVGGRMDRLGEVPGIAFRDADRCVRRTAPRRQIPDIDAQPWPSRESVPIERYLETWRRHHGAGSVSVITARGCPYDCRWCSHAVFGKTHRRRRPGSVVDEIEWILARYGPDMLWFADDVFTIHHGWLGEFADEMDRRSIRIPFECISRADRISEAVADHLARLGCFRIWIGSESGSQRLLDAMERGVTVEQVQRAVETCRARGIQTGMFLMWGYEGEDLADIEATVQHVRKSRPDTFLTTIAYPIAGTPYFGEVADRLVRTRAWGAGSDRDLLIRGRHSRGFYSNADRLLRAEVDIEALRRGGAPPDEARISELERRVDEARAGLRSTFAETEA
jgi:anaerobic magnesium-protoporphyrin IX monomethyl ester cyclase